MPDPVVDPFKTQEDPKATPSQNPSQGSDYSDLLKTIKNESGEQKYDSLPKALEGLANAQTYIPELKGQLEQREQELAELKAKLEGTASVEDLVAKLTAQKQEPSEVNPQTPAATPASLDEKAVADIFAKMIQDRDTQSQLELNKATVSKQLNEKFGDKAPEAIAQKALELGTTPEQLGELSGQSPAMVLALFGGKQISTSPTTSSISLPMGSPEQPELKRPEKSLLAGATSKEQADFMKQIRDEVYRKHNITS